METDKKGFEVICKNCGSKNVEIGSSYGGNSGITYIECRDCDNEEEFY